MQQHRICFKRISSFFLIRKIIGRSAQQKNVGEENIPKENN